MAKMDSGDKITILTKKLGKKNFDLKKMEE